MARKYRIRKSFMTMIPPLHSILDVKRYRKHCMNQIQIHLKEVGISYLVHLRVILSIIGKGKLMRRTRFYGFIVLIATLLPPTAKSASNALLDALFTVESSGNSRAIGDGGKALGGFQLWEGYFNDGCRILKVKWDYRTSAYDITKSRQIVRAYLDYYGRLYTKKTGKPATDYVLARIHNGGPLGYMKKSTIKYANRVMTTIRRK